MVGGGGGERGRGRVIDTQVVVVVVVGGGVSMDWTKWKPRVGKESVYSKLR